MESLKIFKELQNVMKFGVVSYNGSDSEYPAVSRCIWMNSKL